MSTFSGAPYKGNLNFNSLGNPNRQGKVYLQDALGDPAAPILPLVGADLILGFSKYVTVPPAGFAANIFDPVGLGSQNIGFNTQNFFDETAALSFLSPGTTGEVVTLPDQSVNNNSVGSIGSPHPSLAGDLLTPTGIGTKGRVAFATQNVVGALGLENSSVTAALGLSDDFIIHIVLQTPPIFVAPSIQNAFYLSNAAQTEVVKIGSLNFGTGAIMDVAVVSATVGGSASLNGIFPIPDGTDVVITMEVSPTADAFPLKLYFNDVFQNQAILGPGLALAAGDQLGVGFNSVAATQRWFGNIGAVIIQSGPGAIAQRSAVVAMLRGRFGI